MTAHCARCHDHKFDPIKQEDYYSLQAVFAGVDRADRPFDCDPKVYAARRPLARTAARVERSTASVGGGRRECDQPENCNAGCHAERAETEISRRPGTSANSSRGSRSSRRSEGRWCRRCSAAETRERNRAPYAPNCKRSRSRDREAWASPSWSMRRPTFSIRRAPSASRRSRARSTVLQRGSVESPGNPVGPGALSCVPSLPSRFALDPAAPEGARRAALAHWITGRRQHADLALDRQPRLAVSFRRGHCGFGKRLRPHGLAAHASGTARLAGDYVPRQRRTSQNLHKLILMSAAYRQQSGNNRANASIDAENRYLWRMNRQRLDAESVRDTALAVERQTRPDDGRSIGRAVLVQGRPLAGLRLCALRYRQPRRQLAAASTVSSCAARPIPSWTGWIARTPR